MTPFDATALERHLHSADSSVASIQAAARCITSQPGSAAAAAAAWERDAVTQPSGRWLLYLYVANDVVQTTLRKPSGPAFRSAFLGPLLRMCAKTLREGGPTLAPKVKRLVDVWDERQVLETQDIREFRRVLDSRGEYMPPQASSNLSTNFSSSFDSRAGSSTSATLNLDPSSSFSGATSGKSGQEGVSPGGSGEDVDIDAEVEKAAATVKDDFEEELASSDEEDAAADAQIDDPVMIAEELQRLIEDDAVDASGLDLDDDRSLTDKEAGFLSLAETVEFETVGDTLAMEKVEKLADILEKLKKAIAGEAVNEDKDPAKADDEKYETVKVQEKLSMEFATARAVLEAGRKRTKSSKDRNKELASACETVLEDGASSMDMFKGTLSKMDSARKELRSLARVVFLESNRRKRKRISEDRRKELEEEERQRKEALKAHSVSSSKLDMASRMESLLSSVKSSSAFSSSDGAYRSNTGAPPLLPPIPPPGAPPNAAPTNYGSVPGGHAPASLPPIPPPGAPPAANHYSSLPPIPPPGAPPAANAYAPGPPNMPPIAPPAGPPPPQSSYVPQSGFQTSSFAGLQRAMASARENTNSGSCGNDSQDYRPQIPPPGGPAPYQPLPPIPPPSTYPPPSYGDHYGNDGDNNQRYYDQQNYQGHYQQQQQQQQHHGQRHNNHQHHHHNNKYRNNNNNNNYHRGGYNNRRSNNDRNNNNNRHNNNNNNNNNNRNRNNNNDNNYYSR